MMCNDSRMSEKPQPPTTTTINPETKEQLDDAVSKLYALLKSGKGPGESPEADAALKEMTDLVSEKLEFNPEAVTWKDKPKPR